MNRVRFVMVGGFLGAGKTTVIGRLARLLAAAGSRVGIVTNDQAADLVDTQNLRRQGFAVEEVPGACFCCSFPALVESIGRLEAGQRPDTILGEPVGSCTDLAATVIQPLKRLYADRLVTTPLVVLVDPHRARKILTRAPRGGFSPKAAYIYEKQLEEADVIAVNKIDTLSEEELAEVVDLVRRRFGQAPVLAISGRTDAGIDRLMQVLDEDRPAGRHIAEVDYDVYAEGEAELGWLNCTVDLTGTAPFEVDRLLIELLGRLRTAIAAAGSEVAHLKIIAIADGREAVANLVRNDAAAELSRPSRHHSDRVELVVNARVFADPTELSGLVQQIVAEGARDAGIAARFGVIRGFRPGRPVPTHRYADAV